MKGLKGKVALIAGAGDIGVGTAERLAQEGARVVIGSRRVEGAQKGADAAVAAGGEAIAVACDISDEEQVAAAAAAAIDRFGGIDLALLIAANTSKEVQGVDHDILGVPMDVFDKAVATNLRGHILVTRAVLPSMIERGGGSIVYISSEAALIGASYGHFYGATKGGLNAFCRHVAYAHGKQGIRANSLSLDMVWTEHMRDVTPKEDSDARLELARTPALGTPEDVVGAAVFLLSEDCKSIQGQNIALNAGTVMR